MPDSGFGEDLVTPPLLDVAAANLEGSTLRANNAETRMLLCFSPYVRRDETEATLPAQDVPLPLHVVARDANGNPVPVRRGPGRPRKVRVAPSADGATYDAEVRAACRRHVETDAVVRASELRNGSVDLAWAILRALAQETASISWEIEQRPSSRETERARSRRIEGLLAVARLRVEIQRAEAGDVTPHRFEVLRTMLLETILGVAHDTLPAERVAILAEQVRIAFLAVTGDPVTR